MSIEEEAIGNLNVPDLLPKGVNFYDQPPFQEILAEISGNTGTELKQVRIFLSRLASIFPDYQVLRYGDRAGESLLQPDIDFARDIEKAIPVSGNLLNGESMTSRDGEIFINFFSFAVQVPNKLKLEIARLMGKSMARWPSDFDYISTQREGYVINGTPKSQVGPDHQTPSYRSWALKKLAHTKNLTLKPKVSSYEDLRGVLPKGFGTRSNSVVLDENLVKRGIHIATPRPDLAGHKNQN